MRIVMMIAGIGAVLAGALAIAYGGWWIEFSFGNSLIVAGTVAAGSGLIVLSLGLVVVELRVIARRLSPGVAAEEGKRLAVPQVAGPVPSRGGDAEDSAVLASSMGEPRPMPPQWQGEVTTRDRQDVPEPTTIEAPAAPAQRPRRNLMFSSRIRTDRERAEGRNGDGLPSDTRMPASPPPPPMQPSETPSPQSFDDAWPKADRTRSADPWSRRPARAHSTFGDANNGVADRAQPVPREDKPEVTVLKSGVVDGMAYSLYSDGSIEAQMPEGMMRFASLDELTAHIERRP